MEVKRGNLLLTIFLTIVRILRGEMRFEILFVYIVVEHVENIFCKRRTEEESLWKFLILLNFQILKKRRYGNRLVLQLEISFFSSIISTNKRYLAPLVFSAQIKNLRKPCARD